MEGSTPQKSKPDAQFAPPSPGSMTLAIGELVEAPLDGDCDVMALRVIGAEEAFDFFKESGKTKALAKKLWDVWVLTVQDRDEITRKRKASTLTREEAEDRLDMLQRPQELNAGGESAEESESSDESSDKESSDKSSDDDKSVARNDVSAVMGPESEPDDSSDSDFEASDSTEDDDEDFAPTGRSNRQPQRVQRVQRVSNNTSAQQVLPLQIVDLTGDDAAPGEEPGRPCEMVDLTGDSD